MSFLPREVREAAAEAVHRAVCALTGSDGYGHCDLYALAGYTLLPAVTGLDFMPQVGNFAALVQPPNGWFQICAEDGGLARGEYHCWLGLPGKDTGRRDHGVTLYSGAQFVDFGLRHVRTMVERMPQIARVLSQDEDSVLMSLAPQASLIRYTRKDDFPPYLWVEGEPPDDLAYRPDLRAMRELIARNNQRPRFISELRDRVLKEYALLARKRRLPAP